MIRGLQIARHQPEIPLRRLGVRMTEQFLDVTQRRFVTQHPDGPGMTEQVRMEAFEPHRHPQLAEEEVDRVLRHPITTPRHEERFGRIIPFEQMKIFAPTANLRAWSPKLE